MADKKPWEEDWGATASESKKPWEEDWSTGEPTAPEAPPSQLEAAAGGIAAGGTFGFADELTGGLKALAAKTGVIPSKTESIFDKGGMSLSEEYQAQRDSYRDYQKGLEKEHPGTYKTAEMGSALATGVVGGGGLMAGGARMAAKKAPQFLAKAASKIPTAAKGLSLAGAEGGAYGLGGSEADLTEGEMLEALTDMGIGTGLGVLTAGAGMGVIKGGGAAYKKIFGRGGKDLAEDAAGDVLELTPKMRKEATKDIVKTGPGTTSTVSEELPQYLREKGGIIQSAKKIKANTETALRETGEEIDDVLTTYENRINELKGRDIGKAKVHDTPEGPLLEAKPGDMKNWKNIESHLEAEVFQKQKAFKFSELADELEKKVLPLRETPGFESQLAKLDKHIEKLKLKEDIISIKELHQQRKSTDKLIKSFIGLGKSTSADALLQDALISTRRKMSNHIQDEMLGGAQEFAEDLYSKGLITKVELKEMTKLQDRIYKANRNYKMASFVNDQIDQAIGRKDSRRIISLTDWIIMAQGLHSPVITGIGLAAKKSGELIRPRAQLYSRELGKAAGAVGEAARRPAVQQAVEYGSPEPREREQEVDEDKAQSFSSYLKEQSDDSNYEYPFDPEDEKKNAVIHKVRMSHDPEYKKRYMEKDKK